MSRMVWRSEPGPESAAVVTGYSRQNAVDRGESSGSPGTYETYRFEDTLP
jgi:hypothetical protein